MWKHLYECQNLPCCSSNFSALPPSGLITSVQRRGPRYLEHLPQCGQLCSQGSPQCRESLLQWEVLHLSLSPSTIFEISFALWAFWNNCERNLALRYFCYCETRKRQINGKNESTMWVCPCDQDPVPRMPSWLQSPAVRSTGALTSVLTSVLSLWLPGIGLPVSPWSLGGVGPAEEECLLRVVWLMPFLPALNFCLYKW